MYHAESLSKAPSIIGLIPRLIATRNGGSIGRRLRPEYPRRAHPAFPLSLLATMISMHWYFAMPVCPRTTTLLLSTKPFLHPLCNCGAKGSSESEDTTVYALRHLEGIFLSGCPSTCSSAGMSRFISVRRPRCFHRAGLQLQRCRFCSVECHCTWRACLGSRSGCVSLNVAWKRFPCAHGLDPRSQFKGLKITSPPR